MSRLRFQERSVTAHPVRSLPQSRTSGRRTEVLDGLMPSIAKLASRHLRPVAESWQPADFLPDFSAADWRDRVESLREGAFRLSDGLLVAVAGNLITEEALPSYESELVRCEGQPDFEDRPSTTWIKGWTAEENRHGDVLNRYLYLSGRVDMRAIEITVQHLLHNGFFPNAGNDPYRSLIYTAFQERATKIAHGRVARIAAREGDRLLSRICSAITGDEARHESFYKELVKRLFQNDPEEVVLALQHMMRRPIQMPGQRMEDGRTDDLFLRYAAVTERLGVYRARDYAQIFQHLMEYWGVTEIEGLTGRAARARDRLCELSEHIHELAERTVEKMPRGPTAFPWIFERKV